MQHVSIIFELISYIEIFLQLSDLIQKNMKKIYNGYFMIFLSDRSYFHMTDSLSIADHGFPSPVLMSFSVDEMLLPRSVNLSSSFKESSIWVEMFFSVLVHTSIWMYHMDAGKAYKEKAWRQLHKNATNHIEQILEATSNKTAAVQPLTSNQ